MNQRPPGYEPDELPTALLRDIQLHLSAPIDYHTARVLSRSFCTPIVYTGKMAPGEPRGHSKLLAD